MKSRFSPPTAAAVFSAMLCIVPPLAHADMISTQQVATKNQNDADRAKVQAFLDRADVKQQLQAFGVKSVFAKERVAALSDQEVHALARRIDALPAGGRLGQYDIIIILLVAILVVLAL